MSHYDCPPDHKLFNLKKKSCCQYKPSFVVAVSQAGGPVNVVKAHEVVLNEMANKGNLVDPKDFDDAVRKLGKALEPFKKNKVGGH